MWSLNLASVSSLPLNSGTNGPTARPAVTTRCTSTSLSGTRALRRRWRRSWRITVQPTQSYIGFFFLFLSWVKIRSWTFCNNLNVTLLIINLIHDYCDTQYYTTVYDFFSWFSYLYFQGSTPSWFTWRIKIFSNSLILRFDFSLHSFFISFIAAEKNFPTRRIRQYRLD